MFRADEEETIYTLLIIVSTFNQGIFLKDVLCGELKDYGAQSKKKLK